VDISDRNSRQQEDTIEELFSQERHRPFDFEKGPLVRVTLITLSIDRHIVLVSLPSLCADAWTLKNLVGEISHFYATPGEDLAGEPVHYIQFSEWHNALLEGEEAETGKAYWRQQRFSALPALQLPLERTSSKRSRFEPESFAVTIAPEVVTKIEAAAQQYDTTTPAFLLACWQTLLWRLTGKSDIVVSNVCDGRDFEALHGACGVFAKGLPIHSHFEENASFRTILLQIHASVQDATEWQEYFTWDESAGSAGSLVEPAFLSFGFQFEESLAKHCADGVFFSVYKQYSCLHRFKIQLACARAEGALTATWHYDPACVAREHIERLAGYFATLVQSAVQNPEAPASTLELLSERDRQHLLVALNATAAEYPQDKCLHELFEEQVERTPNAMAVVCEEQRLTYAELNARANDLAHYLRQRGVGAEVRVGLCVDRSVEMLIGLLGILKAGGAYVPLNPEHPKTRLAHQIAEIQAPIVLTQAEYVRHFPPFEGELLCLDRDATLWAQAPTTNPEHLTASQHTVYVLYTSGSTGVPKGVVVSHRSVVNYTHFICQRLRLQESPPNGALHFACASTITADLGNTCIFPSLVSGGCLHLLRYEVATDGALFARSVAQHPIDVLKIVPSHLYALLASQPEGVAILPRKYLILGGEALSFELVRHIAALSGTCEVLNHYGPTEATIGALTFDVRQQGDGKWESSTVPIGRPIANTEIYILDQQWQPLPIGVPGDLYLGGVGLAQGYLHQPERTAECFVPHPFAREPGARLYKTGDVGRSLPDGTVEFLGRVDHQVKLRGYRIELGEIEAVLGRHPSVRQAVVVTREDEPGHMRLVAYAVPQGAQTPRVSALQSYLREELPEYMVPSAIVLLDALPLTPNGKVDRTALPAPDRIQLDRGGVFTAPRTPTEELLAGIWARVLDLDTVGIHDNFLALGGHSLLAMRIAARIREAFQVELPLRTLFEAPTVAGVAEEIEKARMARHELRVPPILPVPRDRDLPLSFAQQRLWFLDQLAPGNSFYNVPVAVRLLGALDVAALERALIEIVRHHEVLRTTFQTVEGRPVQVISQTLVPTLPREDLRELPAHEREKAALHLATEEAQRPFDLARGPLLRATLLHMGERDHVLLFTMHHIISDFWSRSVLMQEFATLYAALTAGKPSPLPDLSVQYADFAAWQRQWLQGEVLEKQLAYWKQQLAGSPPVLELPTDRPRPAVQTFRGADQLLALPKDLSDALRDLSRREGVTLFMTLLAAFQTLLHRYTEQADICVGTPVAGRTHPETERMLGFFLNTLVVRTNFADDPSFRDLLRRVRQGSLAAYAHQDLPFEQLVEALQPVRDLSHPPLFQVSFSTLNALMGAVELPGLSLQPFQGESNTAKFDLALLMIEGEGGLIAHVEYNTDLFEAPTIGRMLRHFTRLLEGITADPEQHVSDLPLLTEAERQQLLLEWNRTDAVFPTDVCIHHLFEAQVEQSPDAIAVVFAEGQLTYRALDARANHVAHRLRSLGVGPEMMVGVCMERSLEMVVALLGILKAGGAYVPCDPAYPKERLAFMLEDTQARVLLTQARVVERLPASEAEVICLDAEWEAMEQAYGENPASGVMPENLAYVIYTSGSTGEPKGVLISHGAIANHCLDIQRHYQLTPSDRVLQFASLNFDAALEQIFAALTAGARLVLRDEEVWAPADLQEKALDFGLTVINVPPAYWHQWTLEWANAPEQMLQQQVRLVIIGGDVMQPETLHLWRQTPMKAVRLLNAYGPTETTITATTFEVPSGSDEMLSCRRIPIGRPQANRQAYILDKYGRLVPVGVPGELHIGGMSLARGYCKRPELTAETFVPNPFSSEPGARLYKTGDVARYLPDGNLEYLGRLDQQVKLRGFRIELGEIEAALMQHPAVQEAVVLAREDGSHEKRLVAYLVANQDPAPPPISELRGFLQKKLPEYMVPAAFVLLDALPLTPNGKVDRRALPAPERLHPDAERAYVAPRNPTEKKLTEISAQLLGVARVDIYDNFFEIGGHSLLATQLMSRLRDTFQVELPLRSIFEKPTFAELAEAIEQAKANGAHLRTPAIKPIPRESSRVNSRPSHG